MKDITRLWSSMGRPSDEDRAEWVRLDMMEALRRQGDFVHTSSIVHEDTREVDLWEQYADGTQCRVLVDDAGALVTVNTVPDERALRVAAARSRASALFRARFEGVA